MFTGEAPQLSKITVVLSYILYISIVCVECVGHGLAVQVALAVTFAAWSSRSYELASFHPVIVPKVV